jgi:excisionase family DNA binding protein
MMPPACTGGFFLPTGGFALHLIVHKPQTLERWCLVSEDDEKIAITPAWLNYKQAEAYSNLSRTTLWQLINARKIKAARIGRAVRIERDSLQEFLERCASESGDL